MFKSWFYNYNSTEPTKSNFSTAPTTFSHVLTVDVSTHQESVDDW